MRTNQDEVFLLGTSGAKSYKERDNTFLGITSGEESFMIDCAGSPVTKAEKADFPWFSLSTVFISHFHPDHFYGLPSLIHNMRLHQREDELLVGCPSGEAGRLKDLFQVFQLFDKSEYFPYQIREYEPGKISKISESDRVKIESFPVSHGMPAFGFRVKFKGSKKTLVYSSDTAPSKLLSQAAKDADILIHESSFLDDESDFAALTNHSTAGQAARLAESIGVKRLLLVHFYRKNENEMAHFLEEATKYYSGPVMIGEELQGVKI